jgi:hypothetical protein
MVRPATSGLFVEIVNHAKQYSLRAILGNHTSGELRDTLTKELNKVIEPRSCSTSDKKIRRLRQKKHVEDCPEFRPKCNIIASNRNNQKVFL